MQKSVYTRKVRSALLGSSVFAALSSMTLQVAPASAQEVEQVSVTGYAASLEDSTNAKRQSLGFSDTVFAEDIGKFPDTNIAESFNRIPGITITREIDGSGDNVAIRGLGPDFTKVLLNGAQVVTSSTGPTNASDSNREVDLNVFPTELFTQLTVDKTARADLLEGGAAGTVNMRSARPFDHEGPHLTYSVGTSDIDTQGAFAPRGSLIASDTWGGFGILAGFAGQQSRLYTRGLESVGYTNPNLSAAQCGATSGCNVTGGGNWTIPATVPANVTTGGLVPGQTINAALLKQLNPNATISQIDEGLIPRLGRTFEEKGVRSRYSGVLSLEYRPTDSLHFYLDTLVTKISNAFDREDMDWVGRNGSAIPINEQVNSDNVVTSATFANTQFFLEARPYHERNDYFSINPGMDWDITPLLHASLQANATRSHFFRDVPSILVQTAPSAGNPTGVSGPTPPVGGQYVTYSDNGTAFPVISTNVDLNNPANFEWGSSSRVNVQDEKRYAFTNGIHGDLQYGGDEINVKGGFAFDNAHRVISGYDNSQAWQNAVCGNNPNMTLLSPNTQPPCQGISVAGNAATVNAAAPGSNYPAYPGLGTGSSVGSPALMYQGSLVPNSALAQYLIPGPAGFINVNYPAFFKATNYAAYDYPNAPYATSTNLGTGSGTIDEKNYGLYLETNGTLALGDRKLHYNAGMRWVMTKQMITGPVSIADPRNTNLADGGKYPSIVNQATTDHTYQAFLPSINLVYDVTDDFKLRGSLSRSMTRPDPSAMLPGVNFGDPSAAQATQGNPALKPYYSNNIDVGGELYTGGAGYVGLSVFRKGLSGFTVTGTTTQPFSYLSQYGITYDTLSPTQQVAINSRGGPSAANVTVQEQVNAAGLLTINGIEASLVQPLDFVLADHGLPGFGFTGNLTIVDQRGSGAAPAIATGVSPFTYNVTAYYDHGGISARFSYVFNDRQYASGSNQNGVCLPNTSNTTCPGGAYLFNKAYGQLDFASSLRLANILGDVPTDPELTFDVQNITKSKLDQYFQYPEAANAYYAQGTNYMIGIRGSW
jgi:TonB-dependent receptor